MPASTVMVVLLVPRTTPPPRPAVPTLPVDAVGSAPGGFGDTRPARSSLQSRRPAV
jgi:hypothetical protein